jgi:hypothetical protein
VIFETRPDPQHLRYIFKGLPIGERTQSDNIFVNEDDFTGEWVPEAWPAINANAFLRQYSDVHAESDPLIILPYWD